MLWWTLQKSSLPDTILLMRVLVSVLSSSVLFVQILIALPRVRSDTGKISIVFRVRITFRRPETSSSSNRIRISAKMECLSTGKRSRSFSCTATNSEFLNHKVGLHSLSSLGSPNWYFIERLYVNILLESPRRCPPLYPRLHMSDRVPS